MNFQLFGRKQAPTLLLIPGFAAKPQVKHLLTLYPNAHVQVFDGMNHGQLLVDHPDEVAKRITDLID